MSRKRLVFLAVLACAAPLPRLAAGSLALPPLAESGRGGKSPAPALLVFTYPCTFLDENRRTYEPKVKWYECDYMHASVKDAAATFNALPSLAAQKAFLSTVLPAADAAYEAYVNAVAALLQKSDPAKLPNNLSEAERLKRLGAMRVELSTGVVAAAGPFLWPPREAPSYVQNTAGWWPSSWDPYFDRTHARSSAIDEMVRAAQTKLIDDAGADLEKKMLPVRALTQSLEGIRTLGGGVAALLGSAFDGAAGRGDAPTRATAPAGAAREPAGVLAPIAPPIGVLAVPRPDVPPLPPPIAKDPTDRAQRNYFARGADAGLKRLKDDATVATWRALGLATIVGNPYALAEQNFCQTGPSCAVAAQAQALIARGQRVTADQLTREAYAKGYYVDYQTVSGNRDGGTPWKSVNAVLKDHGVASAIVENAKPQDLDLAIRSSPRNDAIVSVKTKIYWNDPDLPDASAHSIYVTGELVGVAGNVLGYFTNDTGQGEAARFIAKADFDRMWLKHMVALR